MTIPAFDDHPPDSPHVTPYDERHLKTYLRLLDAAEEGADWREVVQIIFDLEKNPSARAACMTAILHAHGG
jgi:predicted secreted protein